jgi:tetratricopeptide (TPR) repeat protein
VENARAIGEATVATCRERRFAGQTMMALMTTGMVLGQLGRPAEGARLVEECIALQQAANAHSDRGMMLYMLAQLQVDSGQLDQAERTVEEGRTYVERNHEESYAAWLAWVRGRLARARGDGVRARAEYEAALAQTERLKLGLLGAHCRLALGLVERDAGNAEAARTALSAAAAAFRTIGIPFWAANAEAALSAT